VIDECCAFISFCRENFDSGSSVEEKDLPVEVTIGFCKGFKILFLAMVRYSNQNESTLMYFLALVLSPVLCVNILNF